MPRFGAVKVEDWEAAQGQKDAEISKNGAAMKNSGEWLVAFATRVEGVCVTGEGVDTPDVCFFSRRR